MANALQQLKQQDPGLARNVIDTGLSGLSAAANLIDLPRSTGIDLLTWLPGGTPAQNPFDQWLTPFSDENRVYGRDILRHHGLASDEDTWGNFLAGMAIDVATDPLTYLTFGSSAALKPAGQVASKAGLLDDAARVAAKRRGAQMGAVGPREAAMTTTLGDLLQHGRPGAREAAQKVADDMGVALDDVVNETLGGAVGLHKNPFKPASKVYGTGDRAQKFARFMDNWSPNPIDPGRRLMDARLPMTELRPIGSAHEHLNRGIQGASTALGRVLGRSMFRGKETGEAAVRTFIGKLMKDLDDAGLATSDNAEEIRRVFETPHDMLPDDLHPVLRTMHRDVHEKLPQIVDDWDRLALKGEVLQDQLVESGQHVYFPRRLNAVLGRFVKRDKERIYDLFDPSSEIGRKSGLKNIEGMTPKINEIARDAELNRMWEAGEDFDTIAEAMEQRYPGIFSQEPNHEQVARNYRALTQTLAQIPPEIRELGVFGNHPLHDLHARLLSASDTKHAAEHVWEGLVEPDILSPDNGGMPVAQFFEKAGFRVEDLTRLARDADGELLLDSSGNPIREVVHDGAMSKLAGMLGIDTDQVRQLRVDPDAGRDMLHFMETFTVPKDVERWKELWDNVTNLTKGMFTGPWPAFHVRNLNSGQVQNMFARIWSASSVRDAHRMMRGQAIKDAKSIPAVRRMAQERGISLTGNDADEIATNLLGELAYAQRIVGKFEGEVFNVVGQTGQDGSIEAMLGDFLGMGREQINARITGERLKGGWGDSGTVWNPLKASYRGVGGSMESTQALMKVGEDIGHYVEGLNRLSPFIKQLRDGVDPAEAARKVGAVQVNYQNKYYTPFERDILMRAFPFYKFCVPDDHEILTRDGWKKYHELNVGDEALQMVPSTGEMVWGAVTDVNVFPHDGPLLQYESSRKGKAINFQFTHGHTWYVKTDAPDTFVTPVPGDLLTSRYVVPSYGDDAEDYVFTPQDISTTHYKGHVWCPTTEHGTWVMRHNGNVIITGNSSKMLPWHMKHLMQRPGGAMGQTMRFANQSRSSDELTPDYVAETMSIPTEGSPFEYLVGKPKDEGTRRYLTGMGLAFEDPLSFAGGLQDGPGAHFRSAGLEALSRLNPMAKAPLEWITGETFFQKGPRGGRDMTDLDPALGRIGSNIKEIVTGEEQRSAMKFNPAVEHIVSNSPLSRAISTLRTLTDTRKGIAAKAANLGTGFRVTDVSEGAQDAVLRERMEEIMRQMGAKQFIRTYFPKDDRSQFDDETESRAALLQEAMNTLARNARERAKARAEEE